MSRFLFDKIGRMSSFHFVSISILLYIPALRAIPAMNTSGAIMCVANSA